MVLIVEVGLRRDTSCSQEGSERALIEGQRAAVAELPLAIEAGVACICAGRDGDPVRQVVQLSSRGVLCPEDCLVLLFQGHLAPKSRVDPVSYQNVLAVLEDLK